MRTLMDFPPSTTAENEEYMKGKPGSVKILYDYENCTQYRRIPLFCEVNMPARGLCKLNEYLEEAE
jgi:hypothetical protein